MKIAKWNKDSIYEKCIELGIEFLDDYYHHSKKNNFKCSCGNTFERLFSNVLKNQIFCKECELDRRIINKKKILKEKFNELNELVKENNQILLSKLSDYTDNKSKMTIVCNCGRLFNPTANNYKRNHSICRICAMKNSGIRRRVDIDKIKEEVMKEHYTFIDAWYIKNTVGESYYRVKMINIEILRFHGAILNVAELDVQHVTCLMERGKSLSF